MTTLSSTNCSLWIWSLLLKWPSTISTQSAFISFIRNPQLVGKEVDAVTTRPPRPVNVPSRSTIYYVMCHWRLWMLTALEAIKKSFFQTASFTTHGLPYKPRPFCNTLRAQSRLGYKGLSAYHQSESAVRLHPKFRISTPSAQYSVIDPCTKGKGYNL